MITPGNLDAIIKRSQDADNSPTIRELIAKCHALGEMIHHDDNSIHDNYGTRY